MTFDFGGVPIDPVEYAVHGSAILGIRASGKSYTATALAEHLFDAGIPFVAFDPIGVWRYLRVPRAAPPKVFARTGRDYTPTGFPVVVAGAEGAGGWAAKFAVTAESKLAWVTQRAAIAASVALTTVMTMTERVFLLSSRTSLIWATTPFSPVMASASLSIFDSRR